MKISNSIHVNFLKLSLTHNIIRRQDVYVMETTKAPCGLGEYGNIIRSKRTSRLGISISRHKFSAQAHQERITLKDKL